MKKEPFSKKDGYRVWLSDDEQDQIKDHYDEEPSKQLAIELLLCGLRSDEIPQIKITDFRKMDTEEEGWMLTVREGKTGFRETPVPSSVASKAKMIKNVKGLTESDSLVDVSKRTIQRYVTRAADGLSESNDDWEHVTAHDLRRTWATHTYWRLSGARAKDVVMAWGGWSDVQTFTTNYLGAIPDSIAIEVMTEAKIR